MQICYKKKIPLVGIEPTLLQWKCNVIPLNYKGQKPLYNINSLPKNIGFLSKK